MAGYLLQVVFIANNTLCGTIGSVRITSIQLRDPIAYLLLYLELL